MFWDWESGILPVLLPSHFKSIHTHIAVQTVFCTARDIIRTMVNQGINAIKLMILFCHMNNIV